MCIANFMSFILKKLGHMATYGGSNTSLGKFNTHFFKTFQLWNLSFFGSFFCQFDFDYDKGVYLYSVLVYVL